MFTVALIASVAAAVIAFVVGHAIGRRRALIARATRDGPERPGPIAAADPPDRSAARRATDPSRNGLSDRRGAAPMVPVLTEHLPAIVWSTDDHGRVIGMEGGGLDRVGLEPTDVIGRPIEAVLGEGPDAGRLRRSLAEATAGHVATLEVAWRGHRWRMVIEPDPSAEHEGSTVGVAVALDRPGADAATDVADLDPFRTLADELQLASTREDVAERLAGAVARGGWAEVTVDLLDRDMELACRRTSGLSEARAGRLEAIRPAPEDRRRLLGPESRPFVRGAGYLVPAAGPGAEDAAADRWQDGDSAFLPIVDASGAVRGTISLGEPADGRRPGAETFDRLAALAALSASALERVETAMAIPSGADRSDVVLGEVAVMLADRWDAFDDVLRHMLSAAAETLDVERVGVWEFADEGRRLVCRDAFRRSTGEHVGGEDLLVPELGSYFAAMDRDHGIVADDAHADPRCRELQGGYLEEHSIGALMDLAIRAGGDLVGIVCFEHVGAARTWTAEDQAVARALAGLLALAYQTEHRRQAEQAAHDQRDRMRRVVDVLPSWVFAHDDQGRLTLANQAIADACGLEPASLSGRRLDELAALLDVPLPFETGAAIHPDARTAEDAVESEAGAGISRAEQSVTDAEGRRRWFEVVRRRLDGDGGQTLIVCSDVTGRRHAEVQQELLLKELGHRVKNVLSALLALVRRSYDETDTREEFREVLDGRINAMARSHQAMAERRFGPVDLRRTIELVLDPFADGSAGRLRMDGPGVEMPAKAATPLCMVMHELATNALKHGALSSPNGRIELAWSLSDRALELHWVERDGPTVEQPRSLGGGSSLIRGFVEHELGGRVEQIWSPEGFECRIRIPGASGTIASLAQPTGRRRSDPGAPPAGAPTP